MIREYEYINEEMYAQLRAEMADVLIVDKQHEGNFILSRPSQSGKSRCGALGHTPSGKAYWLKNWRAIIENGWNDYDDIVAPWHLANIKE